VDGKNKRGSDLLSRRQRRGASKREMQSTATRGPHKSTNNRKKQFHQEVQFRSVPSLPDLPVPAAAPSAWKSWDLPLMLNHFLTRLLDHDSCKKNRISMAFARLTDRSSCCAGDCRGLGTLPFLLLLLLLASLIIPQEQSRGALMQPEGPSVQWRLSALLNFSGCKRWPARPSDAMVGGGWSQEEAETSRALLVFLCTKITI
jgi:hypothetical protein